MRRPGRRRSRRRALTALTATALTVVGLPAVHAADGGPSPAAGASVRASSAAGGHGPAAVADGDRGTYWQSTGRGLPQWVQEDLGGTARVDRVTLEVPSSFGARTQTLAVQGSEDGTSFTTLAASRTYRFDPREGNTATVDFPASKTRFVRIAVTANSRGKKAQLSELRVRRAKESGTDLARGAKFTAGSTAEGRAASAAGDGEAATYWQSGRGALPAWVQADLGATRRVDRIALALPGGWKSRSQTLKLQSSANGRDFTDLTAARSYDFGAHGRRSVEIPFDTTTTRYVRALITANSAGKAAQLGELSVYGPTGGDNSPPSAPRSLRAGPPDGERTRLTWSAAHDDRKVTAYDVYADGELRASVAGSATSFTDTAPAAERVTWTVRARDTAGNQSPDSAGATRAARRGDTVAPTTPGQLTVARAGTHGTALSWRASADDTKVTGYDVYADGGTLLATVPGGTTRYTDTRASARSAASSTTYSVRARDAAGNRSPDSATATRPGARADDVDLAAGKPISASSSTFTYVAENANDGDLATYWEGGAGISTLTVELGADADIGQVAVALNPDPVWGGRTQTFEVQGRGQSSDSFTTLVAARDYAFDPATGNSVTVPVSGRVADLRLRFTGNTGAPGGQVAELRVLGTPAPNPDLTVTGITSDPAAPVESDRVSLSATVSNAGSAAAPATDVVFRLGSEDVGTARVGALAAGESAEATADIGARDAGSYEVSAEADPDNAVIEQNDANNAYTAPDPLVVKPVDSSDLVASPVAWTPTAVAAGDTVAFSVAVRNQGTRPSAGGAHGITLSVLDASGDEVTRLTGAANGAVAAGDTTAPVALGTWKATDGRFTVRTVIADDANEVPVKRGNNTSSKPLFVGRGADMPYDTYEAEDGTLGGGATAIGPNRTVGDLAGEASGRRAVSLDRTGSYVEFTTQAPANTLVTRFSIPDSAGGGGTDATLDVYVDGTFLKAVDLTSKYAWLYGNETAPGNSPGSGGPRHVYDEAGLPLGTTVPAGSKVRLQKDAANTSAYAIDFVDLERAEELPNPDPAAYTEPAGFSQQDVQDALDRVRMDTTGALKGVYLPAGDYETSSKFQVYGKPVRVAGAGPWFTRFHAPSSQENTDVGFRAEAAAAGSSFSGFAYFGNYTSRIDGPGKVFDFSNISDITIDNVWAEHMVCLYWGANTDRVTLSNSRIRDTFADGVNMTNGSTDNHVVNNEARSTGDDSFALFSAIDAGGADEKDNVYENLTALLPWRAAGVAVYGGYDNTFRNIRIADTLVYSGITVSSLDFGYPMNGFGTDPTTLENISVDRSGGHFWGAQTFPGIWLFSASKVFQGIRINDVDITDPTYSGIMFQTNYVGGQPQFPIKDTVLTDVSITGARRSGDEYDAKSGFGLWANPMPETGQGPAVGEVTFHGLTLDDNAVDIENTTSTFTIHRD
ncbi:discoidin domain-containing protein [Streptomyces sp. NPDC050560]|uniref:discoidin domain-containing protein n=1 Tax=Streptomyces sp. NPDC050560 TaxID=3365630 RepID=UPI0037B93E76